MSNLLALDYMEYIGLDINKEHDRVLEALKKDLLLFDSLGLLHLNHSMRSKGFTREFRSELNWLIENQLIFDVEGEIEKSDVLDNIKAFVDHVSSLGLSDFLAHVTQRSANLDKQRTQYFAEDERRFEEIMRMAQEIGLEHVDKGTKREIADLIWRKITFNREQATFDLRLYTMVLEFTRKTSVVPLLPYTEFQYEDVYSKKEDVMQVIIDKMPLPNGETPWEKIIDYRNDPDSQKNLLALRRWIRNISVENLKPYEIEEEIDWLISEFQNHLKIHKIKSNIETLETVVKAPLEIIENLVTFKFSKLPEPLFALRKREISLMEAEQNAPGKEIAYIIKANETFGD
jgi:hypothetical protein